MLFSLGVGDGVTATNLDEQDFFAGDGPFLLEDSFPRFFRAGCVQVGGGFQFE